MNKFSSNDLMYMRRALKLARRGRFGTSPNPCVGCVIVRDGMIIGEGWHKKAGTDHAEVAAIKNAGGNVAGATAYVTLEPCSHYGRTPPCAKTLVQKGIRRVVAAVLDVNPKVSGRGMEILNKAGVKTEVGLCESQARWLNRAFFKAVSTGIPYVTLKLAASLDSKIALPSGESQWITSDKSRQDVQRLRALCDAVITGVNTVFADNPRLTVRYDNLPEKTRSKLPKSALRQPLKVILDSTGRLDAQALERFEIFNSGTCLIVQVLKPELNTAHLKNLRLNGKDCFLEAVDEWISRLYLPAGPDGRVPLELLLRYLGSLELRRVLVEAGSTLSSAFLREDLVDELYLYQGPQLLGAASLPAFNLQPPEHLDTAISFKLKKVKKLGPDVRLHYVKKVKQGG
ncbi:MAG: bifunctional diaminohydroxyphosphoribosylaminopyrimidine deaminase/5-amino-6-(5-phosphoribosylamino)uracil reductase RibD [Proteobacteria bacterium]|uniref:Riboflavin biosynthesis protein RibD n=1 Tax=Candidatus Avisuccinivibrio stercorigallinarum TaxID=2840704 RepID=A0A9D9DAY1_9GAMM|nr:bifunctional diaminohydroxyphosphoribosylaminopyrimidine deaminase/5-amino-6-(5-phosphoribosylamino)uracil reductase RibD [Candidatus Avisuccinivibrio stercorigallinarum]